MINERTNSPVILWNEMALTLLWKETRHSCYRIIIIASLFLREFLINCDNNTIRIKDMSIDFIKYNMYRIVKTVTWI